MKRIKKGDHVFISSGKDKGKTGDVTHVSGDRVIVSNVNIVKCHIKPNPQADQPGGIIEREASLHISNVMPYDLSLKRGGRIGIKVLEDGRKVRVFRSSAEVIDV